MSYTPQTWANGDIITATKLNNIESGVQSVSNSYTPTTWVNGDIITAVKLNNIEQGIANAGGGSSDFSTAEVTIVNNYSARFQLEMATSYEADGFKSMYATTQSEDIGSGITLLAVLYGGTTVGCINTFGLGSPTINATGNAQVDGRDLIITGDCTITIS